ncbi:ATP synthase F1 subunit delta [Cloacibacterium sp.]|uniref:ATP synthase F1 subunit delta n=1 Tax=Cloacibacterium sp. TaxID=1913682 RepID=UPI0035B1FD9E
MLTSKVAKRYAQGLLDFTQESGNTVSVFAEMKDVVKIMKDSKELKNFFASPIIDAKKKISAASQIFVQFSPVAQNLITLVIKQGRESHLQDIAQEFINKVEDLQGVQRVTLTVATQLSSKNTDEIIKTTTLVDHTKNYDLKVVVNPEIIGGYILRVGDQQVDASVRTKLNQVKKEFQLN